MTEDGLLHKTFRIESMMFDKLKKLGMGNASLGLKVALRDYFKDEHTKPVKLKKIEAPESRDVREAYKAAYKAKYGNAPVWAAKENSLANTLIRSVGLEMAIKLAEFYPGYIDPWHVKQRHPFGLLVSQCNKVLTDFYNQKHIVDARLFEKTFDEKVEEYGHESKMAALEQKSELSGIAYDIAKTKYPNLKDYEFDYEGFMQEINVDCNLPYHTVKALLSNKLKELTYEKN